MKAKFMLGFLMLLFAGMANSTSSQQSEINEIEKALAKGYQGQRNLAYGYAHGWENLEIVTIFHKII